ncbi:MAG: hypothetical protein O7C65_07295, partial [Planctomycetota bacterium]|nr:hypothetical protein [Planctomycetota bacterium]
MTKPKPTAAADATATALHPANRLGLDYTAEAAKFAVPAAGIIDVHTHINGPASAGIYRRAAELYGVRLVYSMTHLEEVEQVREVLGSAVRFIAVPNYTGEDRRHHH